MDHICTIYHLTHQAQIVRIIGHTRSHPALGRQNQLKRKYSRMLKETEELADKLSERLGIPKATPESLRAWIEERKRLEAEFRRKIFHQPGTANAIEQLQRHRLSGVELLNYFARLALEVHIYRNSKPEASLPGAITFPSSAEARRADLFSKKVRTLAREMRQFQSISLSPEIALAICSRKTEEERGAFAGTIRGLPENLDAYADFLMAMSRFFRPKRGRRGHPALDSFVRDIVQAVLKTLDEALVSTYGVFKPLAVLTTAAYQVAGMPRRISPKTLVRLIGENRT